MSKAGNPQVLFCLLPSERHFTKPLDFSDKGDCKVFELGCKTLHPEKNKFFDLKREELNLLVKLLINQSMLRGYENLFNIPVVIDDPDGERENILLHLHLFTIEYLKAWAGTYIHNQEHAAQDNVMLFHALDNSMSLEARRKLSRHKHLCTDQG